MSHFDRYDCKIKNLEALKRAIEDLGYGWVDNKQLESRYGSYGRNIVLQMQDKKGGRTLPFGFAKEGENYQLVGDFYGTSINPTKLGKDLTQHTLKHQVIDWMLDNGMEYNVHMEGEIMYVEGTPNAFGA